MFGDVEAAVVDVLRDAPAPALDGVTAATDLIGYEAGRRWLRVVRTGGSPTLWRRQDKPEVTVTVYADDKGDALDLAWAARAAIHEARGYAGHGLTICDVIDDEGLTWSPEDHSPAARYTFRVVLVTKPAV